MARSAAAPAAPVPARPPPAKSLVSLLAFLQLMLAIAQLLETGPLLLRVHFRHPETK